MKKKFLISNLRLRRFEMDSIFIIFKSPEFFVAILFGVSYFIKEHINTIRSRRNYIYRMIKQRFFLNNRPITKTHKDLYEIKDLLNNIPCDFNLTGEILDAINEFSEVINSDNPEYKEVSIVYDKLILTLNKQSKYVWWPWYDKYDFKYKFDNIKLYVPQRITDHENNEYFNMMYLVGINKLTESDRNIIIDLVSKNYNNIKHIPKLFKQKEKDETFS